MRWLLTATLALAACQSGAAPSARPAALELVEAPAVKDVAAYVAPLASQAAADHKKLVVYVGASWCEPCRYFHKAAAAHELDDAFGDLRLVVFDADRDQAALEAAGYRYPMIPLFALPSPDGRASGQQFGGSIKGDGAVAQIAPNLRALVGPR
ncbi:MAG TPA: thioredoxin family protein [Kofleriaceae bacterium]|nr:thioredoxin family protein [Kofleriaceae bacterium]